jgi:hypothetical protein
MFYKKVEKTSDSPTASLGFQESKTITNTTLDNKVLFTYANLNTKSTPYGNLFKSLRLPITDIETNGFSNLFNNTALSNLKTKEIIVAEIPKGQYGELIDGKTFYLKIPVMLGGVASSTTLYGSYFGYNGKSGETITFNTGLNSDLCEKQSYINDLGASPSPNSNITFLYSNEIQKPIGSRTPTVVLDSTTISLTSNRTALNPYLFSISASTNDIIFFEIKQIENTREIVSITDIGIQVGSNSFVQTIKQNDVTVITTPSITNSPIRMYHTDANPSTKQIIVKISKVSIGNLSWNQYTSSNKFPTNENDDSSGKRYAFFDGFSLTFGTKTQFINNYDKPVGILYNDKGLAVITDSTLVSGFRYSAGTSSGYNGITSGSPYNSDTNFAKIYFTSSTLCESNYKSVTTEIIQNVMCIAMPNEFFNTTNSTYLNSYDESVTNKPVFITSIGLYNAAGKLIGVGKLSEPIKKETSSIIPFNIKLKL